MPFGLKNAPATMQRGLQWIIHPYNCDTVSNSRLTSAAKNLKQKASGNAGKVWRRLASLYLDDICVHGELKSHIDDLAKILKRLRGNNVSLKMVKCEFGVTKGKFLGHIVKAKQGVMADESKVHALVGLSRPSSVSALRTLLGASSYLRRFIPDYSDLTRPLRVVQNQFPSKHSVIPDSAWTAECDRAFKGLKAALVSAPVLKFPDFSRSFIVCADASDYQLGAVLCQCDADGTERPIAYASRTLDHTEQKYGITDKEGAALLFAVRTWRPYLTSTKVLAVTDHSSLCQLLTKPQLRSRRQERYALDLMELDLTIVHRAGSANELPDALSRAKIEHDPVKLHRELNALLTQQAARLQDLKLAPGTELHKWQTVLANRGRLQSEDSVHTLDSLGRKWCDEAKLRCLIRGAKLAEDEACTTVRDKLYHMDRESLAETVDQMAGEYSRASEMYAFVSALVIAATTRSKSRPARKASPKEHSPPPAEQLLAPKLAADSRGKRQRPAQLFSTVSSKESPARQRQGRRLFSSIREEMQQLQQLVQDTPITEPVVRELQEQRPVITKQRIHAAQRGDAQVQSIIRALRNTTTDADSKYLHRWAARNYEVDEEGVLVKIHTLPLGKSKRVLVIPDSLTELAIFSCHEGYDHGHHGFVRTFQTAFDKYYWVGMYAQIKQAVKECQVCQMHARAPAASAIAGHIRASRPGEAWVIDVLHMLPSSQGHTAVLVAVDVYSRFALLAPMYSIDSEEATELATLLVVNGTGGVPKWILTDNGPEFKGEFLQMCEHHGIELKRSAPEHSQSHGIVERLVATTELTLAHFIDDDMDGWHKVLGAAQSAHNSAPHPALSTGLTTAFTPAEVYLGRKLLSKLDYDLQVDELPQPQELRQYMEEVQQFIPGIRKFVQESQDRYYKRMDLTARNRRRSSRKLKVGALVKLFKKPKAKKHAKLWRTWQGPYRVLKVYHGGATADIKHVASDEVICNQNVEFIDTYFAKEGTAVPEEEVQQPSYKGKAYEVERIVGDDGTHGMDKRYKVKWKGEWENTWEPEDNLNCPKLVEQYLRRKARQVPEVVAAVSSKSTGASCKGKPWSLTLAMDLAVADPASLTAEICRQAGIPESSIAAQFAFVPCETYSVADYCNSLRGFFYRDHSDPQRPPRPDPGPKRDKAMQHDTLVDNVLSAWLSDMDAGAKYRFFMENPRGMLQFRPFVVAKAAVLGMVRSLVCHSVTVLINIPSKSLHISGLTLPGSRMV